MAAGFAQLTEGYYHVWTAPFMDRGKVPHCPGTGTKFKGVFFRLGSKIRGPLFIYMKKIMLEVYFKLWRIIPNGKNCTL